MEMVSKGATNRSEGAGKREIRRSEAKNGKRGVASVSLVIPTRNEAGNIRALIARIERVTSGVSAEIIFVDDSTDDTPEVILDVSERSRIPVVLIHRPADERGNGLGGAVVAGIRAARGEWVCVMDADLQHPPELIPKLLRSALEGKAEVVVASRYAGSGEADGLGSLRLAASKLCTFVARFLFPRRLQNVSDPLSGFFLVRREAIDPDRLQPRGFKILFEILLRFPHLAVAEIPFSFQVRYSGETKASAREGLRYLNLLLSLRFGGAFRRLGRFGVVGASGIIVNMVLLAALTDIGGLYYLLSAVVATQGSTLWNFAFTESWVFGERFRGRGRLGRLGKFLLMNNGALLLRGPFLLFLTSGLGVHYLISNLITLLALGLARYVVSDGWIWAGLSQKSRQEWFSYDVHGIVRVRSEVRLPELDHFYSPEMRERPDVSVRVGSLQAAPSRSRKDTESDDNNFQYRESVGMLGFWVEMSRGQFMDVVASPLLKRSPHVLYTNVIEPILRWTLVQKGYALVHCACVAANGKSVLITARTDTGKTTTILRLLSHEPFEFMSDDMVILGRDGRVFCYPKPLTISRHTLGAVNGASLSFWERLTLHVQSRIHSKSGRQTALTLARAPLPMATINTIAQILVPPPKYPIQRLIPGVRGRKESRICHMVVIELGPDHQASLDPEEAEETLMRNCEDAYGFPPYPALERFLPVCDGVDLRVLEREIISSGLRGCDTTLIRSQTRSWWRQIPRILNGASAKKEGSARRGIDKGDRIRPTPLRRTDQDSEATGAGTTGS